MKSFNSTKSYHKDLSKGLDDILIAADKASQDQDHLKAKHYYQLAQQEILPIAKDDNLPAILKYAILTTYIAQCDEEYAAFLAAEQLVDEQNKHLLDNFDSIKDHYHTALTLLEKTIKSEEENKLPATETLLRIKKELINTHFNFANFLSQVNFSRSMVPELDEALRHAEKAKTLIRQFIITSKQAKEIEYDAALYHKDLISINELVQSRYPNEYEVLAEECFDAHKYKAAYENFNRAQKFAKKQNENFDELLLHFAKLLCLQKIVTHSKSEDTTHKGAIRIVKYINNHISIETLKDVDKLETFGHLFFAHSILKDKPKTEESAKSFMVLYQKLKKDSAHLSADLDKEYKEIKKWLAQQNESSGELRKESENEAILPDEHAEMVDSSIIFSGIGSLKRGRKFKKPHRIEIKVPERKDSVAVPVVESNVHFSFSFTRKDATPQIHAAKPKVKLYKLKELSGIEAFEKSQAADTKFKYDSDYNKDKKLKMAIGPLYHLPNQQAAYSDEDIPFNPHHRLWFYAGERITEENKNSMYMYDVVEKKTNETLFFFDAYC